MRAELEALEKVRRETQALLEARIETEAILSTEAEEVRDTLKTSITHIDEVSQSVSVIEFRWS